MAGTTVIIVYLALLFLAVVYATFLALRVVRRILVGLFHVVLPPERMEVRPVQVTAGGSAAVRLCVDPRCGHPNVVQAQFCARCGESLSPSVRR